MNFCHNKNQTNTNLSYKLSICVSIVRAPNFLTSMCTEASFVFLLRVLLGNNFHLNNQIAMIVFDPIGKSLRNMSVQRFQLS